MVCCCRVDGHHQKEKGGGVPRAWYREEGVLWR